MENRPAADRPHGRACASNEHLGADAMTIQSHGIRKTTRGALPIGQTVSTSERGNVGAKSYRLTFSKLWCAVPIDLATKIHGGADGEKTGESSYKQGVVFQAQEQIDK